MWATLRADIQTFFDRDPAARSTLEILLCYPGLHALWFYRVAHWLWEHGLRTLGRWVSHWGRFFTGIEIHPGAKIGPGLVIDHGMAVVIGETAEIGRDVTLYHNVTLGGVDLNKGKRHPTVEECVVIGAGAQVLGNIRIGAHSRIGANAVVVKDVAPGSVVTGVPGRARARQGYEPDVADPDLHHNLAPDVTMDLIQELNARVVALEAEVTRLRAEQRVAVN